MSGYYPDGVTGNEYQIAGADREWDDERRVACQNEHCLEFEVETDLEVALSSYRSTEWGSFTCPACGMTGEYEAEVEVEEDDPDRFRD